MSFMAKNLSVLTKQSRILLQATYLSKQLQQASLTNNAGIRDQIDSMVKKDEIVVFMKGTPNSPSCGFSRAVVQILNMHGVKFDSYNILEDADLRSGIKEYSNWPTIPQIFFKGKISLFFSIFLFCLAFAI